MRDSSVKDAVRNGFYIWWIPNANVKQQRGESFGKETAMAYKKPEVVKMPPKRENFSTEGNVKMVYGNGPNSLPECVSKPIKKKKKLLKG